MTAWETKLTTRDTNRIVRPLEWGFDWLKDFSDAPATPQSAESISAESPASQDLNRMIALNQEIVRRSDDFFGYQVPQDFRLEHRHPELYQVARSGPRPLPGQCHDHGECEPDLQRGYGHEPGGDQLALSRHGRGPGGGGCWAFGPA